MLSAVDIALVVMVTAQAVGMGYVHSPRAKSLLYMLPFPFSLATMATGHSVDATHVVGMCLVWGFVWLVWFLHAKRGMNIIAADLLAIGTYVLLSLWLTRVIPPAGTAAEWTLFGVSGLVLAGASIAVALVPHAPEPGHRSSMPLLVKALLVFGLVLGLVLAKTWLRGFMPAFPLATTFAVYEARHSLRTLAVRFAMFGAGWVPMAFLMRALLPEGGGIPALTYLGPLALGWLVYIPISRAIDRLFTLRALSSRKWSFRQ